MKTTLIEKARENRNSALKYVDRQKSRLIELTGFRVDATVRTPFPSVGFVSTRTSDGHLLSTV